MSAVVRAIPPASQRRLEVTAGARGRTGGRIRRRRRHSSTSSSRARSANPPMARKRSRATKIAWSPVAMPLSRERREIMRSMTRKAGCTPESRTGKLPQPGRSPSASNTARSASPGSFVSACRNTNTSPVATSAPAFIWRARPRGAARTRSASPAARSRVPSVLPPSETMTSCPRSRRGRSASSAAPMTPASSRAGTTMESRPRIGSGVSSARPRNCSPAPPCSRSNGRGPRSGCRRGPAPGGPTGAPAPRPPGGGARFPASG